jgi:hypothetical protein
MNREPAKIIGAVAAFLIVVVNAIVLFGLNLSADQVTAVISVINAGGVLATALFIREKVFSPAAVNRIAAGSTIARDRLRRIDVGKLTTIAKRSA